MHELWNELTMNSGFLSLLPHPKLDTTVHFAIGHAPQVSPAWASAFSFGSHTSTTCGIHGRGTCTNGPLVHSQCSAWRNSGPHSHVCASNCNVPGYIYEYSAVLVRKTVILRAGRFHFGTLGRHVSTLQCHGRT